MAEQARSVAPAVDVTPDRVMVTVAPSGSGCDGVNVMVVPLMV